MPAFIKAENESDATAQEGFHTTVNTYEKNSPKREKETPQVFERNDDFCVSTLRAGVTNDVNRVLMGSTPFVYISRTSTRIRHQLLACPGMCEGISPPTGGEGDWTHAG